MRRLVKVGGLLVVLWLAFAGAVFVWPHGDPTPAHADAVVVLGGDVGHRLPEGLGLVRAGVASTLVLSREPGPRWERGRRLCATGDPRARVVCFSADPYSTRGEAQAVSRLASRNGWTSLVVVTSDYHVTRTRILFDRCYRGDLAVVGVDYDRRLVLLDAALETVKLARAGVQRGC